MSHSTQQEHAVSDQPCRAIPQGWAVTPLQQQMLRRSALFPQAGFYVQQVVWKPDGPVGADCLVDAFLNAAQRHEVLRAHFIADRAGSFQLHIASSIQPIVDTRDYSDSPAHSVEKELSTFLATDRGRGFELQTSPPWRVMLFRSGSDVVACVWSFHHALLDGRSHNQLFKEIVTDARRSRLQGGKPVQSTSQFTPFLEWLRTRSLDDAAGFWRSQLQNVRSVPGLPSLGCEEEQWKSPPATEVEEITVDEATTADIRAAANQHGVTVNNLIQGAWALLLGRYNGVEDVTFGVVRSGRHARGETDVHSVGMFINAVPFRVNVDPAQRLRPWLTSLREQQIQDRKGEFCSPEQIRAWAGIPAGVPLMRSLVMFESHDWRESLEAFGGTWSLHERTDLLTLSASLGKRINLSLEYSPFLHPSGQASTVLRQLAALLDALVGGSEESRIGDLTMMPPAEPLQLATVFQGAALEYAVKPLLTVLEEQAVALPRQPAIESGDVTISYEELHRRANQLSRHLLTLANRGARVCVVLDRCPEQIITWLAILKADMVYAPVDPGSPQARLDYYLVELSPAIIVSCTGLRLHLKAPGAPVVFLDGETEQTVLKETDATCLNIQPRGDSAASILFTSGSTGRPKGAINSHRGLSNIAAVMYRDLGIRRGDRVLLLSSPSFDASILEMVLALQVGATVVCAPASDVKPGQLLADCIARRKVTALVPTPTVLRLTPVAQDSPLRTIVCCGEPLPPELLHRWGVHRRFFNIYGPTECSIYTTCEACEINSFRPTIGKLVDHCRGYVLDSRGELVPVGVPGELFIGGVGVGLGYWNRPDLTAERFLPDPFARVSGATMYRTGDLVRWLADGRLEYLGRLDSQVKVGGIRVELGEIEATLEQHPQIQRAAVQQAGEQLKAWLVARDTVPGANQVRAWLADRLPLSLIPSSIQFVGDMPRTSSGKVDRISLFAENSAAARASPSVSWVHPVHEFPRERSVIDLFRDRVVEQPASLAIQDSRQSLTFSALDRLSNQVAQQLLRDGLTLEEPVALLCRKSCEFAVAALGVMKAGGAYLPIDVCTPLQRARSLLMDARARFVFSTESRELLTDWDGTWLQLQPDFGAVADLPDAAPQVRSDPARRAYVIYTSGSTGHPKGVEVEHHSLTNLVCFYQRRLKLTVADRATMLANIAFDASVADLWPVLCAGGSVIIPPDDIFDDIDGLIAWLVKQAVTFCFVPTAIAELLLERRWPANLALRFLATGGDTLRVRPPGNLPFTVLNTYGPTENTVDSTWSIVKHAMEQGYPAIGRPIDNVAAYVLDSDGDPVSPGVAGELYLGGEQVARGYFGREDLTRGRFLPDPFANSPNAKMYRTGDWVRRDDQGNLHFIGRQDDQVQVRGHRVELAEVELALSSHPGVRAVCCRPIRAGAVVTGIAAHVVLKSRDLGPGEDLRQHVARQLPVAMIPAAIYFHDRLPITDQGKVDRTALDAMPADNRSANIEVVGAGSTRTALARLWNRLLPAHTGDGNTSFAALGGDSLTAIRLLLGVEEITRQTLPLSSFLIDPTFEGLCRAVAAQEKTSASSIIAIQPRGSRPPLFCIYGITGDVGAYFELADALGQDQPLYGVRSPALQDPSVMPASIEAAASYVLSEIRACLTSNPPAL